MDSYLNLPIDEDNLQQLVADAKDFVYALGKETEKMLFDVRWYLEKLLQ